MSDFDPNRILEAVYQPIVDEATLYQGDGLGLATVKGEAFVMRLVACWNACLGIPTERLEGEPGYGARWRHEG